MLYIHIYVNTVYLFPSKSLHSALLITIAQLSEKIYRSLYIYKKKKTKIILFRVVDCQKVKANN